VVFTLTDGTHSVSHTVSTMTASTRQWSTTCTATTGSNVLTSCGSTAGLFTGERLNVPGVKGQAEINALTASTITLASAIGGTSATPTTGGAIALANTPGSGEGLADGAFVGAKITSPNLGDGVTAYSVIRPVATCSTSGASTTITLGAPGSGNGQWLVGQWITGTNIPYGDYLTAVGGSADGSGSGTLKTISAGTVSGNCTGSEIGANPGGATVTTARVSTSATTGTAAGTTAVIQHTEQGASGTVTVTLGNPLPVYAATFTSSDFTNNSIAQGVVWVRAQAYPVAGNVILDTQLGADRTRCDWFWNNVGTTGAGTCNSSNAAWFGTNDIGHAEDVSVNLHNLWAYYDADNSYSPVYCAINSATGTATTTSEAP
jgi:hypothetical protein